MSFIYEPSLNKTQQSSSSSSCSYYTINPKAGSYSHGPDGSSALQPPHCRFFSHCRSDQNLNIWPPSRVPPYRLVYGLPYRSRVMALRYSVDRPTVQGHHNTSHIRSFSTSKLLQEEKWSTSTKTFATIINLH